MIKNKNNKINVGVLEFVKSQSDKIKCIRKFYDSVWSGKHEIITYSYVDMPITDTPLAALPVLVI
jgi:hypothetical protein